jgi:hypothetical protein
MSWSLLTAKVRSILTATEAQRNEPGINQIDNCGPACVSCIMQILGYQDIEPQDLVGPYYRGGTTGPQLNAIIAKRYPNPPPMSYLVSANPLTDLANWAGKGWLSLGLFWSDGAAVVKPYNTGIGHWCIPVADDGNMITFWNPEWGAFDRFSHSDFLKASWRQFDVCQRSIPGGDDDMDQAKFNELVSGNPYLQDIAFRLDMLLNNRDTQAAGPSKGQPNALKAELDALKAELDALKNAAGTTTKPSAAFDATITPRP